ncbi:putative ABC transport system permease protein [Chryseobacterium ginsenosidimutans]|nr:putative ABC transport system permease protein [Chryseobacterium ginsenosidimutans]
MNIIFKKDTWQEIYYSLRNNKLRTFLTMIGVGWGMFLYVSLLGAAKGMENGFDKLFSGFATNSIFLWAQNTSIPYDGFPKGRQVHLKLADIDMLKRKIPEIDYISPQNSRGNFGNAGEQMSKNGKSATYTLNGDYPLGNKISEKKLIFGRYLNDADISGNKNVVVIGEEVYKNFFDAKKNENPLGKSINIKGIFFNVIGVFRVKKGGGLENDQTVFIPLSTFTKMYNNGDNVDFFAIVSKPNADVNNVETKVKQQLKSKNNVSPDDTNAFGTFNLGKEFKKLTGFLTGMQLLTIIVGTLTILAGVIAISNILLITVKERNQGNRDQKSFGRKTFGSKKPDFAGKCGDHAFVRITRVHVGDFCLNDFGYSNQRSGFFPVLQSDGKLRKRFCSDGGNGNFRINHWDDSGATSSENQTN